MPGPGELFFILGLLAIMITALVALRGYRRRREQDERASEQLGNTPRTRIHDPRYKPGTR